MVSESLHRLTQQLQVVLSSLELDRPDLALIGAKQAAGTCFLLQREWNDYRKINEGRVLPVRTLTDGQVNESKDVSQLETLYLILRRRRSG